MPDDDWDDPIPTEPEVPNWLGWLLVGIVVTAFFLIVFLV